MSQDERVHASIVLRCGQWYLAHGTAQRRLLENSATSLPAGLQKKVSINTQLNCVFILTFFCRPAGSSRNFFGRPIYTNVTKLNYFWHSFFVRDITSFTKLYCEWTYFFIAYLARILTVFGRKRMLWQTATTADALSPLGTSCTQAVSTRDGTSAIRTEGVYKYDRHRA